MAIPTLADESRAQQGFYVPQFEIRIEGVGLPRDVLRDVSQVTYKDSLKEIDGFELTVNNWDATTRQFKYVGGESGADLKGSSEQAQRTRLFDPCNREVEVRAGYLGDLRTLVRGTFTTLEPSFPASGPPTLAVRGLNALHTLRRKQYSTTWNDKKDSEIAKNIGQLTDPQLGNKQKRFPMPIVISDEALGQEQSIPYVAQSNQYDIDFLFVRAKRLGYVVCIREGDKKAKDPDRKKTHLYFGPSDGRTPGAREPIYKLRWRASLIDFKPTLTTANQVKSVTVKGWDRTKKKAISEKVSLSDKELALNKDLHDLLSKCDPRDEVVVEKPVHTKEEARKVALGILKDRHKEIVKASATCVGLPALSAGSKVEIEGLGSRFSGMYYVTATTHTLGDSGYTTRFEARREATGSLEGLQ
jgi:phage protein D